MQLKKKVIDEIIRIEGGYVNDPADSGGETKYGITVKVARQNGYKGPMTDLPRTLAFIIYEKKYWSRLCLDEVLEIAGPHIAEELADSSVNAGQLRAGKWLQRSLNVFDKANNLKIDGKVGDKTILALYAFIDDRGDEGRRVLYNALNCLQGAHYINISTKYKKNKRFVFGWFSNRVDII